MRNNGNGLWKTASLIPQVKQQALYVDWLPDSATVLSPTNTWTRSLGSECMHIHKQQADVIVITYTLNMETGTSDGCYLYLHVAGSLRGLQCIQAPWKLQALYYHCVIYIYIRILSAISIFQHSMFHMTHYSKGFCTMPTQTNIKIRMVITGTSKIKQLESWKINIHMYKKGLQYIHKRASVKQFTSYTTIFRNLYSDILSSLPITSKSVKHSRQLHSPLFVHV
jgi:hypothetical protein